MNILKRELSAFLSVDIKDVINAIIMAFLGAIIVTIWQACQLYIAGWTFWQAQLKISMAFWLATASAYILKRFFSNRDWTLFLPDTTSQDTAMPTDTLSDGNQA